MNIDELNKYEEDEIYYPNSYNLTIYICLNCSNNEYIRIWFNGIKNGFRRVVNISLKESDYIINFNNIFMNEEEKDIFIKFINAEYFNIWKLLEEKYNTNFYKDLFKTFNKSKIIIPNTIPDYSQLNTSED